MLIVFGAIALGAFLYPSYSSALTLTPTRVEISGNPGDTLNVEMTIIN
ncbi:MAG: hypothetical protein UU87_C0009G0006, partial [Parcubacteria group bacterium GW2011_GWA2_42_11]